MDRSFDLINEKSKEISFYCTLIAVSRKLLLEITSWQTINYVRIDFENGN